MVFIGILIIRKSNSCTFTNIDTNDIQMLERYKLTFQYTFMMTHGVM